MLASCAIQITEIHQHMKLYYLLDQYRPIFFQCNFFLYLLDLEKLLSLVIGVFFHLFSTSIINKVIFYSRPIS